MVSATGLLRLFVLLVTLLEGIHLATACQGLTAGCSVFKKCCGGFTCHPWIHKCYHSPRSEGEPCSAGYGCGPELQCEAGAQRCRPFGTLGAACHVTKKCASGFTCQPGVHKCYSNPRKEGQPCSAGYGCEGGLHCEAGTQICKKPGTHGEACHATRPCGSGLSCQPGVHKCYSVPRKFDEPCVAGHSCGPNLFCKSGIQRCRGERDVGESCSSEAHCKDGLTCQPGVHKCYHSPRLIGEPCSLGFGCDNDKNLSCASVIQRCVYGTGFSVTDIVACQKHKDSYHANIAKLNGSSYTFGSITTGASVYGASVELGIAFGPNGEFGCYSTTCTGTITDVGSANHGVGFSYYPDFNNIAGRSKVAAAGASTPFFEVGYTTSLILSTTGTLIGWANSLSIGIGLVPAQASTLDCDTTFLSAP